MPVDGAAHPCRPCQAGGQDGGSSKSAFTNPHVEVFPWSFRFGERSRCCQVRMEHDDKGEWREVMFVPAGALTQPTTSGLPGAGDKQERRGAKGKR